MAYAKMVVNKKCRLGEVGELVEIDHMDAVRLRENGVLRDPNVGELTHTEDLSVKEIVAKGLDRTGAQVPRRVLAEEAK